MPLHVSSFGDLLREAREQKDVQRLLFVFVAAGVPANASTAHQGGVEPSEGGTLTPLLCVDRLAAELPSFEALRAETRLSQTAWDIVFVSALSGKAGIGPSAILTEAALQRMVEQIKLGRIQGFIPFDHEGQPLFFA
jgi:hypothetical protein